MKLKNTLTKLPLTCSSIFLSLLSGNTIKVFRRDSVSKYITKKSYESLLRSVKC